MKQIAFDFFGEYKKEFGGSLLVGKRKEARPLSTKHPLHLVLKTSEHRFFSPGDRRIESVFRKQAEKYKVKLYKLSLNWSHVHLTVMIPSRDAYNAFIRTVTALLIKLFSQIRGIKLKRIFDLRPFTKILSWGRQFSHMMGYHDLNEMEAFGLAKRDKKAKKRSRPRS